MAKCRECENYGGPKGEMGYFKCNAIAHASVPEGLIDKDITCKLFKEVELEHRSSDGAVAHTDSY